MAKHLTTKDIHAIVNLIRGWDELESKLTWTGICQKAEALVGRKPTRQSLNSHEAIVLAYQTKKGSLKGKIASNQRRPASLQVASSRIANLEAELAEVKEENRRLKEQFMVWQYNASHWKTRMTEKDLNRPLPKIDRERSDKQRR